MPESIASAAAWIVLLLLLVLVVVLARVGKRRRRARPARHPQGTAMGVALSRVRDHLESVWSRPSGSAAPWKEMEEDLIAADMGVKAARRIVEAVRDAGLSGADEIRAVVRAELNRSLAGFDRALHLDGDPSIIVLVGVNGSGKTTTVAKLASRLAAAGKSPLVGGADTYRPAADSQLKVWADRLAVPMVSGARGADPASVAYDALQAARARGADVLIVDTAGRLHTSHNLMEELAKIVRVLGRDGDRVSEVLLVMDATTGQSGLAQARRFARVGVTGVVLTKLDGTAKGGVVLAIENELSLPVKYVGVGEGSGDLLPFDGPSFVDALVGA
ncbi:MAG: signal recognition particle-docking protein FtsY [bacterium]|nr:signal recognition particle-docking protein FtsY [bacterium]MDE0353612.1 signal recognition particle-docking protein FtsY [bacterium]